MKVKRFVADNLQEAILKVKSEMGRDAIILHTKKFKEGGILGFFSHEKVEITAAVDDFAPKAHPNAGSAALPSAFTLTRPAAVSIPAVGGGAVVSTAPPASPAASTAPAFSPPPGPARAPAWEARTAEGSPAALAPSGVSGRETVGQVQEELKEMKQVMHRVLHEIGKTPAIPAYPMPLNKIHRELLKQGVEEKLADQLIQQLMNSLPAPEWTNLPTVKTALGNIMQQQLKEPSPIDLSGKGTKIVVLVGPTGVGKTTTLAKLAANYSLIEKRKIALLTIDTYRIAAVEQLRTYAQIIGIPLEVVFNPRAMAESLQRHGDKELILVDTAGRSPKNAEQMEEINDFIKQLGTPEVLLVISATTGMTEMRDIYRRFKRLSINKVVFTKLDEAVSFGPVFNLASQIEERLSYLTMGQNVPDDIEIADPYLLVKLILGDGGEPL